MMNLDLDWLIDDYMIYWRKKKAEKHIPPAQSPCGLRAGGNIEGEEK
ncbi:MAG: hypothetical protein ACI4O0_03545 [Candidatus Limivicinus sp.]